MGHAGIPKAESVKTAIEQTLQNIVAAGKTPGMPAASNNIAEVLDRGVRYIYTHLPKLLKAGSTEFLRAAGR
jgi:2-keto-3-deoxy-L-rhamnonate aldolase RhmA